MAIHGFRKGFLNREIPTKALLALRIVGSCLALLTAWGLWYGSFSAITFVLIVVIGAAAGYAFHVWTKHLEEKYMDEYPTEKEKQKLLKWLSMGKWKFVFVHGFLIWGIIYTTLASVQIIWSGKGDLPFLSQLLSVRTIIVLIIMISILGISSGLIMWNGIQKTAQKYSLPENSSDDKK